MIFATENWNNPDKFVECLAAFAETADDGGGTALGGKTPNEWAKEIATLFQQQGIQTATELMNHVKSNPSLDWLSGVSQATIHSIEKFLLSQTIRNTSSEHVALSNTVDWDKEDQLEVLLKAFAIEINHEYINNPSSSATTSTKDSPNTSPTSGVPSTISTAASTSNNSSSVDGDGGDTSEQKQKQKQKQAHEPTPSELWATKQVERFKAHGLATPNDVIHALRDKDMVNTIVSAGHINRTTMGGLNQFLSSLRSPLHKNDNTKFVNVLMEYALVHEVKRTMHLLQQQPHYYRQYYKKMKQQQQIENEEQQDPNNNNNTDEELQNQPLVVMDVPYWANERVDQLGFAMIETAIELIEAIQHGELDRRLEDVGITRIDRPTKNMQKRLNQFLLPLRLYQNPNFIVHEHSQDGHHHHHHHKKQRQSIHQQYQQSLPILNGSNNNSLNTRCQDYFFETMVTHACPEQAHLILYDRRNYNAESYYYSYEQRQQFWTRPYQSRLLLSNPGPNGGGSTTNFGSGGGGAGGHSSLLFDTPAIGGDASDFTEESMGGFLRTKFSDQQYYNSSGNNDGSNSMGNGGALTPSSSSFEKYCHLVWQSHRNGWSANATLSNILTGWFDMSPAQYASEACILASALSEGGTKNISFFDYHDWIKSMNPHHHRSKRKKKSGEKDGQPHQLQHDEIHIGELRRLCPKLFRILFRNVAKQRFLSNNYNTYRLAHCLTEGQLNKLPLWIPTFSFLLQLSFLGYVGYELYLPREVKIRYEMIALAALTSFYIFIQAVHGQAHFTSVKHVYQYHVGPYTFWMGPVSLADVFANRTLPILMVIAGFLIITRQETFVDGVLIAAALLFVPHLDKQLPTLLNLDAEGIIQTYLVRKAVDELSDLLRPHDYVDERHRELIAARQDGEVIEFNDIFVTNITDNTPQELERGFGPHEVIAGHHIWGLTSGAIWRPDKVYMAKNIITEDCLLKEVRWRYKRDHRLPRGYIEKLALVRLDGKTVELTGTDIEPEGLVLPTLEDQEAFRSDSARGDTSKDKRKSKKEKKRSKKNKDESGYWDGIIQGILIVTQFEMKQSVTKLRICGSRVNLGDGQSRRERLKNFKLAKNNFQRAVEYYSLWELDSSAVAILSSENSIVTKGFGTGIGLRVRSMIIRAERAASLD